MKKTLIIIMITIFALMANITVVQAATTLDIEMTSQQTSVKQGDTVKVIISVKNINGKGVSAISGILQYNSNIFNDVARKDIQVVQDRFASATYNPNTKKVATELAEQPILTENSDMFEITLTAKENASIGSTTIGLTEVTAVDNDAYIYLPDISCQIQITDKNAVTPTPTPASPATKPTVTTSQEKVANGVKITLTSDKELKVLTGWELSANKKQLSRVYTSNFNGTVTVESVEGVKSDPITINVVVTEQSTDKPVIEEPTTDKTAPTGSVRYTKGANGVTVTITANEQVKNVTGWTLSTDKKTLSRVFGANYTGTVTLEDLAGNKSNPIQIKVDTTSANGGVNVDNAGGTSNSGAIKTTETSATSKLPKTGTEIILPFILAIAAVGGFAYFKYRGMKY